MRCAAERRRTGTVGGENITRFSVIVALEKLPALRARTLPLLRSVVADPDSDVRRQARDVIKLLTARGAARNTTKP